LIQGLTPARRDPSEQTAEEPGRPRKNATAAWYPRIVRTLWLLVASATACGTVEQNEVDGDTDTDMDTESESDSDSDSDSGSDADTDTDTDTDSDTGSGYVCDPVCPEGMTCVDDGGCAPTGGCGASGPGTCPPEETCECTTDFGGSEECSCKPTGADGCSGDCRASSFCACVGGFYCYCEPFECGRTGECAGLESLCVCGNDPDVGWCTCDSTDPCDPSCTAGQVCADPGTGVWSCEDPPYFP
jgi:hypothetical protein